MRQFLTYGSPQTSVNQDKPDEVEPQQSRIQSSSAATARTLDELGSTPKARCFTNCLGTERARS